MAEAIKDVLEPGEIDLYVRTLEPSEMISLGSSRYVTKI